MKKLFIVLVCFYSIEVCAQSPIAYNLQSITTSSSIANSSPPGEWSGIISDGAYFAYDRVARTYGDPNRALPAEYYRIDAAARSKLYDSYSTPIMQQETPKSNPVSSFFDVRRINAYNRDMEEWRKSEKAKLKRYGVYDREAIRYLYSP
jgi:hypothetical protein